MVDFNTFDINLMMMLLRFHTSIPRPLAGFDNLASPTDITPGADLERIRFLKNYLGHLNIAEVHSEFFKEIWDNLSGVGTHGTLNETCLHQTLLEVRKDFHTILIIYRRIERRG